MSKKIRRVAVLSLCVVIFAAVQPACAGSVDGALTGACFYGSQGAIVGGIIGFCVGGSAGAAAGAGICGIGGAVVGGVYGYNMTPEQIAKAKEDIDRLPEVYR